MYVLNDGFGAFDLVITSCELLKRMLSSLPYLLTILDADFRKIQYFDYWSFSLTFNSAWILALFRNLEFMIDFQHILLVILEKVIPKFFTISLFSYTTPPQCKILVCRSRWSCISCLWFECASSCSSSCLSCYYFNMNSVANMVGWLWLSEQSIHLANNVERLLTLIAVLRGCLPW